MQERGWISESEFQDGIAAANLLPGPAAIQLGIYCAWRLRGPVGAVIVGVCFALPGVVVILGLSVLFLAERPSLWLQGAAASAGAAVAAVAVNAALRLMPASWRRVGTGRAEQARRIVYTLLGGVAAATMGPYLEDDVLVGIGALCVDAELCHPMSPYASAWPAICCTLMITNSAGLSGAKPTTMFTMPRLMSFWVVVSRSHLTK